MSSSYELVQANTLSRFKTTSASRSSKKLVKSVASDWKIALDRTKRNTRESMSNLARVVHRTRCRWSCMSVCEKCSHLVTYIKRKRWIIAHEHLGNKTEKTENWERYDRVRATHVDAKEKIETRLDSIIIEIWHIFSKCDAFWSKENKTKLFLIFSSDLLSRSSLRKEKIKTKTFFKSNFLRQQIWTCSERNDASKKKEVWWDY
jgi:hypothetical protein